MDQAQIASYGTGRADAPIVLVDAVEAATVDAVEEFLRLFGTVVVGRAVWADTQSFFFGYDFRSPLTGTIEICHALFELVHNTHQNK
jgi:hypothetical protein